MRNVTFLVLVLSFALLGLSACCSKYLAYEQENKALAITVEELDSLLKQPPLQAQKFRIQASFINQQGDKLGPIYVAARVGEEQTIEISQEVIYPTAWDLPQVQQGGNSFPVIPAAPRNWKNMDSGKFLTLKPTIRGSLVQLEGEYLQREVEIDEQRRASGEAFAVITQEAKNAFGQVVEVAITENQTLLPDVRETRSAILLVGRPDVEHRIELKKQGVTILLKTVVLE